MKNWLTLVIAGSVFAYSNAALPQDFDVDYVETIKKLVRYTLVSIRVKGELPDGTTLPETEATGFLISHDGHVVTAKHVALTQVRWDQYSNRLAELGKSPLSYVQAKFSYTGKLRKDDADAESFSLIPIATSETADLAVLKVSSWTQQLRRKGWPILPIGALDSNSVNMKVSAWGFPKGESVEYIYGDQFTGAITNYGVYYDGKELASGNFSLQPGASGGPVFNRRGHIVGVVYGGRSLGQTSYFTPGNVLGSFIDQLGIVR